VAPPKILSPVETLRFRLNDVGGRTETRGQVIILPSQLAHGYHWALEIFVRGSNLSSINPVHLAICLILTEPADATVEAEFVIKAASIKTKYNRFIASTKSWFGFHNFITREELLNAVPSVLLQQDGSLTFDVDLRVYQTFPVWYPQHEDSLAKSLMVMGSSSFSTMVTFMVGDVAFCLHRHVVADRAPALYKMIDGGTGQTVHLTDDVDAGITMFTPETGLQTLWMRPSML
jgi:hypothetical protein